MKYENTKVASYSWGCKIHENNIDTSLHYNNINRQRIVRNNLPIIKLSFPKHMSTEQM